MIKRNFSLFVLFILLFTISCTDKKKNSIDIAKTEVNAPLYRFDKLFTDNAVITNEILNNAFEEDSTFVLNFSSAVFGQPTPILSDFQDFNAYFDSIGINKNIKEEFAVFPEYKTFVSVQKRVKTLFKEEQEVGLTTMNSGFNYKTMLFNDQIAVGLELYLGDRFDYTKLGDLVNDYQTHRFNRDYIIPDVVTSIVDDKLQDKGEYNTFLKRIIYEGKKVYLKSLLLPDEEKYRLFEFTLDQYRWCEENEQMMWQYFITEELLYSNDIQRWKTYVFDGPFSAGMPENAPARTGNFIGYKIIESYMSRNKDLTINQLLENENEIELLKLSKYAP